MLARYFLFTVALQRHLFAFCCHDIYCSKYIYRQRSEAWIIIPTTTFFIFSCILRQGSKWSFTFNMLLTSAFQIEQGREEPTRALHIFVPFNSSDVISDISVSFSGFSSHCRCIFLLLCSLYSLILQDWCLLSLYLIHEAIKGT